MGQHPREDYSQHGPHARHQQHAVRRQAAVLGLADVASKSGVTLAVAAIVRGAMMDAVDQGLGLGLGNQDWSVLARMVQQRAALRK